MKLALLALMGTLAFAQAPAKDAKKAAPAPAPKAAPAPAPKATPSAGGFVGNKDSKVVHKADCKTAVKMKAGNRVAFGSMAEAEKAGFKACKVCKP